MDSLAIHWKVHWHYGIICYGQCHLWVTTYDPQLLFSTRASLKRVCTLVQAAHLGRNLIRSLRLDDLTISMILTWSREAHLSTAGFWSLDSFHCHWASVALFCYFRERQPDLGTPSSLVSQGAGSKRLHWGKHPGREWNGSLLHYLQSCLWGLLLVLGREGRKVTLEFCLKNHLLCASHCHTCWGWPLNRVGPV